ncbi:hypothetical protein DI383_02490 [Flavobacteriaceae bacterium LYZ1037]|nr:hypothetical protein DI383_02490 [Flavobacteriaceae bacterium LYZ1037]
MLDKNQVFNIIRDNLTRDYIFYIPERYYPYIENSFIKDIIKPDMLNIIAYFNSERKITSNTLEFNGLDILNKETLLNNTIDLLINQKEILSETAFNHLLEQYKEHVDAHGMIISWMSKNLLIDLPMTSSALLNMFKSQALIFEKHQVKFRSYFGFPEIDKKVEVNESIKDENPTIETTPFTKIEIPEATPSVDEELKTTPEKVEKEEKEPLMTDEKARRFLLETVFKIDSKHLEEWD